MPEILRETIEFSDEFINATKIQCTGKKRFWKNDPRLLEKQFPGFTVTMGDNGFNIQSDHPLDDTEALVLADQLQFFKEDDPNFEVIAS